MASIRQEAYSAVPVAGAVDPVAGAAVPVDGMVTTAAGSVGLAVGTATVADSSAVGADLADMATITTPTYRVGMAITPSVGMVMVADSLVAGAASVDSADMAIIATPTYRAGMVTVAVGLVASVTGDNITSWPRVNLWAIFFVKIKA